ncbi:thiamine phosphate synthase [Sneathiella limimaris]|uniref:thiamine phosphate synthase n=1 Tax=Sneathiella limimaris TaxID=1964213 RepID=UPI00146C1031|nr:thiamine phosphate synthase [Sneathiella limimaris]
MFLQRSSETIDPLFPSAFYFTDDNRSTDLPSVIARLPSDTGVIFRHYDHPKRKELAAVILNQCARRQLPCFIAKDAAVAYLMGADGVHLPEYMIPRIPLLKHRYHGLLISVACHNRRSLLTAERLGADLAFLSPLFPTKSHPGARTLSPIKASTSINLLKNMPVYGLGGVTANKLKRLKLAGFKGFGAISLFEES